MDESKIDECFPLENYRRFQRETIVSIVRAINSGKKFVIAECPVGSGKSPIAVTLAKLAGEDRAYYITTTKMLQDQIEKDFPFVSTLKGRSSYDCTIYDKFGDQLSNMIGKSEVQKRRNDRPNCSEGFCKTRGRSSCKMCMSPLKGEYTGDLVATYSHCDYYEKIYEAADAQTASMNFDNFILHLNYGGRFGKRKILIVDESHNAEDKLLDFLHCSIDGGHLSQDIPNFETPLEYVLWLLEIQAVDILKTKLMTALEEVKIKEINFYESLIKKYMVMMKEVENDPEGWVCEYVVDNRIGVSKAILKPIYVRQAANKYLFKHADIVVLLSATILNAKIFASNLGIKQSDCAAMSIPSVFPIKNRPIYIDYVGKFTGGKSQMDQWMPTMVAKIEEIADKYEGKRGIIHAHSFGIQKAIFDNVKKSVRDRLIQQHDFANKTDMLAKHATISDSIIIAPAMHEGVDLKDELSRFQVICKVPYANYFENKQMSARMELDPNYYPFITIMKICQSVGRSIRSDSDYADTYIIDGSFDQLFNRNRGSFPKWFTESIVILNKHY